MGGEFVRERIDSGVARRVHLVARTAPDARDVMVEGISGLLSLWPQYQRPEYEPSKRRVTFHTGAIATLFSADEPDLLRGPQCDTAWCDELAAWKRGRETWQNVRLGLRLGRDPRCVVTSTPKPSRLVRELLDDASTHVTGGSLNENRDNLAPSFVEEIERLYRGTRTGRQEIEGLLLEDVEGAYLTRDDLDQCRVQEPPDMVRIVVGVDNATTANAHSDSTGISVAGKGDDGDLYALADRTCKLSPEGWARRAVDTFDEFNADLIVCEKNAGGDLIKTVLRQVSRSVPIKMVQARRGKHIRAEPILMLFEPEDPKQPRATHGRICGSFPVLEDQLVAFTPDGYEGDESPDAADAFVHAATELMVKGGATWSELGYGRKRAA